jgi:uncharacterized protein involved in response to NO
MKFSKFSDDNSKNYFFSQPHQPFFILAFVNAIITMLVFLLSYKGIIHLDISSTSFHAYGLIYLLFTPAFLAFLFTTFPRFASTPVIEKQVYMNVFGLYYIGSILFLLGSIISPFLSAVGMLFLLGGHALGVLILKNIYITTTMEDKQDIYWILLAMSIGLGSHFLFIVGELFNLSLFSFSIEIASYLYLFLLAFTVAQRMVPFFSHSMVEKDEKLLPRVFGLLVLHVVLESIYTNASFVVDLGIAFLVGKELLRWKLPFPNPNPLLTILHVSLFWVPVAFSLGGLTNFISLFTDVTFLALDIHVLLLGFVFTILIGFGTRVTIGHSGNMMQADKWVQVLFIWTQVVVGLRILVSLVAAFGWNFMILFDISVTAWLIMFIAWAVRFFAVLITGKKLT